MDNLQSLFLLAVHLFFLWTFLRLMSSVGTSSPLHCESCLLPCWFLCLFPSIVANGFWLIKFDLDALAIKIKDFDATKTLFSAALILVLSIAIMV